MKPPLKKANAIAKTAAEVLLLALLIAIIYWLLAPDPIRRFYPVTMADLQGVWSTSHPSYQDRFLQFSDGPTITFGWGEDGAGSYSIEGLADEAGTQGTLVTVRYRDLASTSYRFSFHYVDQSGGMIVTNAPKGVYWFRTSRQATDDLNYQ